MGKSKLLIWILTILLLCAAVFGGIRESSDDRPLYAQVTANGHTEALSVWYDTYYGIVYVFLPGYARMDQVQLKTCQNDVYQVGPYTVTDGMSCEQFALNEAYPIIAKNGFPHNGKHLMFVQSAETATLFLDLKTGSTKQLHSDKSHSEPARVRLYGDDGSLLFSGNADSISGRGQSSWEEEKKSYNLTLESEVDLLQLGSARRWVLQANAKDPSNLRNKLVYDFAARTGLSYTPGAQWVDLYLNGDYAGLYLLLERIEPHPERVNISGEGSFLVSKDYFWRFDAQGDPYITTAGGTSLGILYNEGTNDTLLNQWQSAENAILAENGIDPITGNSWDTLIDPVSWAKKFLLEETLGNLDAPLLSQYYYRNGSAADSRICAGPAWDYDLSFAGTPNQIFVYRGNLYTAPWNHSLYQKEGFRALLEQQYETVFRPLLTETIHRELDLYAQRISAPSAMNARRWHLPDVESQIADLKTYLTQRTNFLDTLWLEHREYVTVSMLGFNGSVETYLLEPGSVMPELNFYPEITYFQTAQWYYSGTDIPVDPEAPVYEDTTVEFRWEAIPPAPEPFFQMGEPLPRSRFLAVLAFIPMMMIVTYFDFRLHRRCTSGKQKKLSSTPRNSEELYEKT